MSTPGIDLQDSDVAQALDSQSGTAQRSVGMSISTFLASMATAAALFGAELLVFLILKGRFPRIYEPRTYLVPDRERTEKKGGPFHWVVQVFRTKNKHFIEKCGLDAYFFLRYLRMLIKIFAPLSLIVLPILLPLNKVGGKDQKPIPGAHGARYNVTGFDQLAWGNIRPENTHRYWGHLVMAVAVIVYVCYVFFDELRDYVRMRQDYLTSPEHRLRASATTVLVSSIPEKWLSVEKLEELFDVYPGGLRNIWLNRNCDELNEKVKLRDGIAIELEKAETELIKNCKKAQLKKKKKEKKQGERSKNTQEDRDAAERRAQIALGKGKAANDPHQIAHTIQEAISKVKLRYKKPGKAEDSEVGAVLSSDFSQQPTVINDENREQLVEMDMNVPTEPKAKLKKKRISLGGKKKKEEVEDEEREYPVAYNENFEDDDEEPVWKKYISQKDRETMRLPIFGISWMPSLPLLGKKVDKVEHLRKELARLNLEIEIDQQNPEKFPRLNSAFIQFNHQVAAHMACQSIAHHIPNQMTPRMIEISPDDVIWDNMAMSWWESYLRSFGVLLIVAGMVIGWAFPVAFTGLMSQISYLEDKFNWLKWIQKLPEWVVSAIQGLLPPLFLSILMALLPMILRFLSKCHGNRTGMTVELTVQKYYFTFLFVQLFLIVSISSSFSTMFRSVKNVMSIPQLLAQNIPRASNYFFSYMVLQALSVSAGALVQIVNLLSWFVLAPLLDKTARMKFARTMNLNMIQWGTFFPVYTTLASIGLIYCVIAPLIMVFNILTFSMFWFVYRYNTLYVTKFRFDTGGLLFPTAINQLFTGIYIMEVCLIGLFFLVRDQYNRVACQWQAVIMIIVFGFTILYQWLLNKEFSPLLMYLPVSLEDDACRREEEFFEKRQPLLARTNTSDADASNVVAKPKADTKRRISWAERVNTNTTARSHFFNRSNGDLLFTNTFAEGAVPSTSPTYANFGYDLESQSRTHDSETPGIRANAIGQSLFEGIYTELADLTADERDRLVQRAFQHEALRTKRPVIWIPRDDLGVSDDEIYRTQRFSKHIWISNEYQALDGKCRTIFSRSPPDFSEVDLIQL